MASRLVKFASKRCCYGGAAGWTNQIPHGHGHGIGIGAAAAAASPRRRCYGGSRNGLNGHQSAFRIGNGSGNGNGNGNGQQMFLEYLPGVVVLRTMKVVMDYYNYGFNLPKPRIRECDEVKEVIELELPTPGLNRTSDIDMLVDVNNRFKVTAKNQEREIYYLLYVDLPREYNFEKACFKPHLQWGMVYVTITNFNKKEVRVPWV